MNGNNEITKVNPFAPNGETTLLSRVYDLVLTGLDTLSIVWELQRQLPLNDSTPHVKEIRQRAGMLLVNTIETRDVIQKIIGSAALIQVNAVFLDKVIVKSGIKGLEKFVHKLEAPIKSTKEHTAEMEKIQSSSLSDLKTHVVQYLQGGSVAFKSLVEQLKAKQWEENITKALEKLASYQAQLYNLEKEICQLEGAVVEARVNCEFGEEAKKHLDELEKAQQRRLDEAQDLEKKVPAIRDQTHAGRFFIWSWRVTLQVRNEHELNLARQRVEANQEQLNNIKGDVKAREEHLTKWKPILQQRLAELETKKKELADKRAELDPLIQEQNRVVQTQTSIAKATDEQVKQICESLGTSGAGFGLVYRMLRNIEHIPQLVTEAGGYSRELQNAINIVISQIENELDCLKELGCTSDDGNIASHAIPFKLLVDNITEPLRKSIANVERQALPNVD